MSKISIVSNMLHDLKYISGLLMLNRPISGRQSTAYMQAMRSICSALPMWDIKTTDALEMYNVSQDLWNN